MKMGNPNLTTVQPPQVVVFHHPQAKNTPYLLEVKFGLEEEGIPFSCQEKTDFSSIKSLAFAAAETSVLGVGLGVDRDQSVVLHYHRLDPDSPLFVLSGGEYTFALGRIMGNNAARLVKGNPFKFFEEEEAGENFLAKGQEQEELVKTITKVVQRILQEKREEVR